jgi:hypothetical protein
MTLNYKFFLTYTLERYEFYVMCILFPVENQIQELYMNAFQDIKAILPSFCGQTYCVWEYQWEKLIIFQQFHPSTFCFPSVEIICCDEIVWNKEGGLNINPAWKS